MFVCFQMRSTFPHIYIDKFSIASFHLLIKEDLREPIESFHNFYVSNKFAFISYIESLEKLNTKYLVCYNLYSIFVVITIYHFNCDTLEIFSITIVTFILNSYYLLNYLILIRKRRTTRFISTFIDSIRMFFKSSTKN